jgi:hypothetical protein
MCILLPSQPWPRKAIDIATEQPKRWTPDMLEAVNVGVTMGCGDAGPILPGRRYDRGSFADIGEEAPASSPTSTTEGREAALHCSDSAHQVKQTAGWP